MTTQVNSKIDPNRLADLAAKRMNNAEICCDLGVYRQPVRMALKGHRI